MDVTPRRQSTRMDIVTPKHTDILLFALIVDPADLQPTVGTDLAPDIDLHRGENPVCRRFRYPCAMTLQVGCKC